MTSTHDAFDAPMNIQHEDSDDNHLANSNSNLVHKNNNNKNNNPPEKRTVKRTHSNNKVLLREPTPTMSDGLSSSDGHFRAISSLNPGDEENNNNNHNNNTNNTNRVTAKSNKEEQEAVHFTVPLLTLYSVTVVCAVVVVVVAALYTVDYYNQQSLEQMTSYYTTGIVDSIQYVTQVDLSRAVEAADRIGRRFELDDVSWSDLKTVQLTILQAQASYGYRFNDAFLGDEYDNFTEVFLVNGGKNVTFTHHEVNPPDFPPNCSVIGETVAFNPINFSAMYPGVLPIPPPRECLFYNYRPTIRPWYRGVKETQTRRVRWSDVYVYAGPFSSVIGTTASRGVWSRNGQFRGVVGVDATFDEISHHLESLSLPSNSVLVLLERVSLQLVASNQGSTHPVTRTDPATKTISRIKVSDWSHSIVRSIASRLPSLIGDVDNTTHYPIGGDHDFELLTIGSENFYFAHRHIFTAAENLDWVVVFLVPEDSVKSAILNGRRNVIYLTTSICIAVTFLAFMIGWASMLRPLQKVCLLLSQLYLRNNNNNTNVIPTLPRRRRWWHKCFCFGSKNDEEPQVFVAPSVTSRITEVRNLESTVRNMCLMLQTIEAQKETIATLKSATRDVTRAPRNADEDVTILFTDIESSTRLWGTFPDIMADAMEIHHTLMRKVLDRYDLYEVKTIGDAFMIAAYSAAHAVRFALDVQEELYNNTKWSPQINEQYVDDTVQSLVGSLVLSVSPRGEDGALKTPWNGLRVRIGMHTGLADVVFDQVSKGYDYYGSVVNTAARVESVGHGGQVLATQATWDAACRMDPTLTTSGYSVMSLGPVELRGVEARVALYQLLPKGDLSGRTFPPLRIDKAQETSNTFGGSSSGGSHSNNDVSANVSALAVIEENNQTTTNINNMSVRSRRNDNKVPTLDDDSSEGAPKEDDPNSNAVLSPRSKHFRHNTFNMTKSVKRCTQNLASVGVTPDEFVEQVTKADALATTLLSVLPPEVLGNTIETLCTRWGVEYYGKNSDSSNLKSVCFKMVLAKTLHDKNPKSSCSSTEEMEAGGH